MRVSLVLFCVLVSGLVVESSIQAATDLRVEYLASPVHGIDTPTPRFSYTPQVSDSANSDRGVQQSGYQIQVSVNSDVPSGDVWDSGLVSSSQTSLIKLGSSGTSQALKSDTQYYWRVRWQASGTLSAWSSVSRFTTGFLQSTDWKAEWITGFNQLRKEFSYQDSKPVVAARAYICGLGYSELYLNGHKISDHLLSPAWTNYPKRSEYLSYDVSAYLAPANSSGYSTNALGVLLGQGWWGQGWGGEIVLLFQLHVYHSDGSITIVTSDSTWRGSQGPITYDSIYNGETYNSQLEQPGWNTVGFNDASWGTAKSTNSPIQSGGKLSPQLMPAIKRMTTVAAQKITQPQPGVYVVDFGQNLSGWVKIRIPKGTAKGTNIVMKFAELLMFDGSGMIYTANLRTAKATDTYIANGLNDVDIYYEPRFTYHGFQFMQLTGYPSTPQLTDFEAIHVYTSVDTTGRLLTDNAILNRIQQNIWWGQTSNLMSVPTDCDQRDERLGWMADGQLSAEEAIHNFDVAAFYVNWIRLMGDEVGAANSGANAGSMTDTVPHVRYGSRPADPAWGAAYPLLVYWIYRYYGDLGIVNEQWAGLTAYAQFLQRTITADGGIGKLYGYYGDWVPPPPAPKASVSFTSGWYAILNIIQMSQMAQAIGQSAQATQYSTLASQLIQDFNTAWFRSGSNTYDIGVQCDLAMPLFLGQGTMVSSQNWNGVANSLISQVAQSGHLNTGILGTKYLMLALSQLGRTDLAVQLSTTTGYPGWTWEFDNQTLETPATTLWELWDSPEEGPGMNSRNHIMFGSWSDWAFKYLLGIQQASDLATGYRNVSISPSNLGFSGKLGHAEGHVDWAGLGKIAVNWTATSTESVVSLTLPVNVAGDVAILTQQNPNNVVIKEAQGVVWQNGKYMSGVKGVVGAVAGPNNKVVLSVQSGTYTFAQVL